MNRFILLLFPAIFLLNSCMKEDERMMLPPSGELKVLSATMGVNYDDQVYADLETGITKSVPYRSYDLAFEASPDGWRLYLNTGKLMFVKNSGTTDFATADSSSGIWTTETEHLYDDSTAFGTWFDNDGNSLQQVYVIDRGRVEHFGTERWRKMQILSVNDLEYRIRFSNYNNTQLTEMIIPKDDNYSLMYFSFSNGGQVVEVAPQKHLWDVVFTKYTYTYHTEPLNSPYRYYLVAGALLNKWAGHSNLELRQDSTVGFIPFEQMNASQASAVPLNTLAGAIGFNWKMYDFNLGYVILSDRYYLTEDHLGFRYKIRFLDFYDDQGNKGTVKLEYQRL